MDAEFVKSVAYYADRLITLLLECDNEDFVDDVTNCVSAGDKGSLDDLRAYVEV